jgi:hypothetical protein
MATPITPREAIGNKLELEKAAIDALTERVNTQLSRTYDGRRPVSVSVDGSNEFVIAKIKEIFQAKGWVVREESGGDMRDSYHNLVFSEAKSITNLSHRDWQYEGR